MLYCYLHDHNGYVQKHVLKVLFQLFRSFFHQLLLKPIFHINMLTLGFHNLVKMFVTFSASVLFRNDLLIVPHIC
jgi:hypothetical protein